MHSPASRTVSMYALWQQRMLTGPFVDSGSSVLLGAYLAGLTISYIAYPPEREVQSTQVDANASQAQVSQTHRLQMLSFEEAYGRTIGPLQRYIFSPIFFASIGYGVVSKLIHIPT